MPEHAAALRAIARAVALTRPEVCAYAVASQMPIVEVLREMIETDEGCGFIGAESESAALSVAIGAAAAGARTYTATSSHGLLAMAPAVYNAAELGLPVVMTVGSCAAMPNTAANDHCGSLSMRDAGWIQLFAGSIQEAADLHIQAFRLAGETSCPVMVCMDGLGIGEPEDRVDIPAQAPVDEYLLPAAAQRPAWDGDAAGAATVMAARGLEHPRQRRALERIPPLAEEFWQQFGRDAGGLVRTHHTDDAEVVVVVLGLVAGAIRQAVDEMRARGARIGLVSLCTFRPFPVARMREVLGGAKRVVIIERSLAAGPGAIVTEAVRQSLAGTGIAEYAVIAGAGSHAIARDALVRLLADAVRDALEPVTILDTGPALAEPGPWHAQRARPGDLQHVRAAAAVTPGHP